MLLKISSFNGLLEFVNVPNVFGNFFFQKSQKMFGPEFAKR